MLKRKTIEPAITNGNKKMELDWKPWTGQEDIPLDKLLLIEIEGRKKRRYQTGTFWKNDSNQILGTIGHAFVFDCKPIRWAVIDHIV